MYFQSHELYKFSFFDILPYFYLLFFLIYFTYKENVKGRLQAMFWLLFIFSSLRYGIGYDYFNYCEIIKKGDNFEPLSHILANIARKSHCIQIFFIINSFLAIYPIYYVAKRKSEDACFTLLMYYLWPILFLESLSIVRNASAYSFIFLTFAEQFEANPDKGCSVMKTWGSLVLQRGIFYRFMPE